MTEIDANLAKWLNLIRTSPTFVLKDTPDGGAKVLPLKEVPANDGFYWIGGKTTLASGQELVSVFHVDTDSAGELCGVYWWVDERWVDSQDPEVGVILGSRESVFPFDWAFSVPLEENAHHSQP